MCKERFLGAEDEEAKLDGTFHSKAWRSGEVAKLRNALGREVQELFHQEVALHFEYEVPVCAGAVLFEHSRYRLQSAAYTTFEEGGCALCILFIFPVLSAAP